MIRRTLWNRGGGVFVEEAGWSPHARDVAAGIGGDRPLAADTLATMITAEEPSGGEAAGAGAAEGPRERWVHVRIVTER